MSFSNLRQVQRCTLVEDWKALTAKKVKIMATPGATAFFNLKIMSPL
jgi:hypothetical protein